MLGPKSSAGPEVYLNGGRRTSIAIETRRTRDVSTVIKHVRKYVRYSITSGATGTVNKTIMKHETFGTPTPPENGVRPPPPRRARTSPRWSYKWRRDVPVH